MRTLNKLHKAITIVVLSEILLIRGFLATHPAIEERIAALRKFR